MHLAPQFLCAVGRVFHDFNTTLWDDGVEVVAFTQSSTQNLGERDEDLERSIDAVERDVVLAGTPIDLGKQVDVGGPVVRVGYEIEEGSDPTFDSILEYASELEL